MRARSKLKCRKRRATIFASSLNTRSRSAHGPQGSPPCSAIAYRGRSDTLCGSAGRAKLCAPRTWDRGEGRSTGDGNRRSTHSRTVCQIFPIPECSRPSGRISGTIAVNSAKPLALPGHHHAVNRERVRAGHSMSDSPSRIRLFVAGKQKFVCMEEARRRSLPKITFCSGSYSRNS